MNVKKIIVAVIACVIVAAAVLLIIKYSAREAVSPSPTTTKKSSQAVTVNQRDVDPAKLPEKFPADLPLEMGVTVSQNYNATTSDDTFQATRVFETKKSLADNYKLYQDALKKSGYAITASVDQDKLKVISATKNDAQVQITISENSITKVKSVNISVTMAGGASVSGQ